MQTRQELEQIERDTLAPCAAFSADSRGRDYPVSPCDMRTDYQRDRDRVIHSAAFRKLEYKTQVYVIHEGDYYRTRLTHTMEVAQIARSLARGLRLNQDLAEAVALAHDLGHTPFGHSGEATLHKLLEKHGGFEHNRQGLRVVELLEERYEQFPGLNLTWEVREGIAKHTTIYDSPSINRFDPGLNPPLEAQIVDVADQIAYNHHDLDDALKMGLIARGDLEAVPWIAALCRKTIDPHALADPDWTAPRRYRLVGALIDMAVRDVLETTSKNIEASALDSLEAVRRHEKRLVSFSEEMREHHDLMSAFLLENVYRHPHVVRMVTKGERFIQRLYRLYHSNPAQLPRRHQSRIEEQGLERVIADYISGMTDRYCLEEYKRAFLP